MTFDHIAVVGASLAGLRAAEALRRHGFGGQLTLVGAEEHLPYDRPPLSKQLLAGTWGEDKIELRRAEGLDVVWRLGTRATALDLGSRSVSLETPAGASETMTYDGLVIATGCTPRMIPGTPPLDNIFTLRTLEDCRALTTALARSSSVVVIGAGFIGAEVAATARSLGLQVTVLEALAVPLGRVLGDDMGALCGELHRANGTDLRLGVGVTGFAARNGRVTGVELADGTSVAADVVVVGVGVAPCTGWLEDSGLTIADGVVCDSRCRAVGSSGTVVAAGDVARWEHPRFGSMRVEHWTNAVEQAQAAARGLLDGDEAEPFGPIPYFWSDQYGTKIQYVGHGRPTDEVQVVEGDPADGRFVAAYGRSGDLVAALAFNRPSRIMAYRAMIAGGTAFPPPAPR